MAATKKPAGTGRPAAGKATSSGARAVRGSRTGRPVMALLDLLGRRWALRILWELGQGPLPFRALRERCDEVSPSVLNTRLAELREAGLVELGAAGYATTDYGAELGPVLLALDELARRRAG